MDLALKFLGPRARSTKEVRDRLEQACVPGPTIEEVLARLEDLRLLNDSELAAEVAGRARTRGESSNRIQWGLKSRGLPEEPGIASSSSDTEEVRALELARKRARALSSLPPKVAHRRLAAYLTRRGYDFEIVEQACLQALTEAVSDS